MFWKHPYFSKSIVIAFILIIIGILLMCFLSENPFWNNVSSVLLVSGAFTVINDMFLKRSLIELILQKIELNQAIHDTGLTVVNRGLDKINYRDYFKKAKSNIDIIHNYGKTWTENNFGFIEKVVLYKKCKLRIVLLNPNSLFVPALAEHYGCSIEVLKKNIEEAVNTWRKLYQKLKKLNAGKRSRTECGILELYFFNGQPTNSIYRIDNSIILIHTKNSKGKSIDLPYLVFQKDNDDDDKGFYDSYLNEVEAIIQEADKVNLEEPSNDTDNTK